MCTKEHNLLFFMAMAFGGFGPEQRRLDNDLRLKVDEQDFDLAAHEGDFSLFNTPERDKLYTLTDHLLQRVNEFY